MIQSSEASKNALAWVVFIDVYGFSNMVSSEDNYKVYQYLELTCRLVSDEISNFTHKPLIYTFSDCMFMVFLVDSEYDKFIVFDSCEKFTSAAMSLFVDNDLPVRGGVSYGEIIYSSNVLIGNPVVRAVKYESIILEPVVIVPSKELKTSGNVGGMIPTPTEIFLKDGGLLSGVTIMPCPIDKFRRMVADKLARHSVEGPPLVAKAWHNLFRILEDKKD